MTHHFTQTLVFALLLLPGAVRADEGSFGHRQARQAKRPAGPARQQRYRRRRQHGVWRPGDGWQWRGEQQKPCGLAGLGGTGQLGAITGDAGGELGFGARRVGHAQLGRCGSDAVYGRPSGAVPVIFWWIARTLAIASRASLARPKVVTARK